MITDIFNKPLTLVLDKKDYTLEYDNNAYTQLEQTLGKGIFRIFDEIINGSLSYNGYVETALCGLLKHHSKSDIDSVKKELEQKQYLLLKNVPVISTAYISPLTPPETMGKAQKEPAKKVKKK